MKDTVIKYALDLERMDNISEIEVHIHATPGWRFIWCDTWDGAYNRLIAYWEDRVRVSKVNLNSNEIELQKIKEIKQI
jgi:hypothetical protein